MILGIDGNGLSEFLTGHWSAPALTVDGNEKGGVSKVHGSWVVLVREGLVAFSLQSVSHTGMESKVLDGIMWESASQGPVDELRL